MGEDESREETVTWSPPARRWTAGEEMDWWPGRRRLVRRRPGRCRLLERDLAASPYPETRGGGCVGEGKWELGT